MFLLEDGIDSTGTIDGGSVVVQLDGVSGVGNIAAELQTAINHANGHNGGSANSVISISRADGILTLTQVVKGENGNQTITYTGGTPSHVLVQGFTGGQDAKENKNCLWYNQRAERTVPALSSSIASVNTNRQTLLDIATTDNSGSYLKRYQGSTYVLRKLSKPYKEGVSFSKQFKGGVNFDENKKVDYWKGLLKIGAENGILVADPQNTFVDDTGTTDKHCLDGKDKNPLGKNKLKLSVFVDDDENGSFDNYEDNAKKANTVMPFNFYTVKETTDTKIDTTDSTLYNAQSFVNIHHDGYGQFGRNSNAGTIF